MTGEWKKLHNEEFHDLYSLTQYCSGDKIEKNGLEGACSAYGGEEYTGFWWGNLGERDHLGDPGVGGKIILRWIFRKLKVANFTFSEPCIMIHIREKDQQDAHFSL